MSRYKTPLRYPGGKQRLAEFIAELIDENGLTGGTYVEPYAGGAGIALELLSSGKVSSIHLNDSCLGVYNFWKACVKESERFCRRIRNATLSVDEWKKQRDVFKNRLSADPFDVAFSFFFLNRVNRSGIIWGGLIGGLDQAGDWLMDARFPRTELIRRIELVAASAKRIRLRNWDAERFISEYLPRLPQKSLVYFDPPYFNKADRLYTNHYLPKDHERLASEVQRVGLPWLVSYDNARPIHRHYAGRRSFTYGLQYNAARSYIGREAIFFSDALKIPSESRVKIIDGSLRRQRGRLRQSKITKGSNKTTPAR